MPNSDPLLQTSCSDAYPFLLQEASAPEQVDQEASADGPDTPQAWQEAYHTLNLLIKIMKHCPREVWIALQKPVSEWTGLLA